MADEIRDLYTLSREETFARFKRVQRHLAAIAANDISTPWSLLQLYRQLQFVQNTTRQTIPFALNTALIPIALALISICKCIA
jgi:hypothetical protein